MSEVSNDSRPASRASSLDLSGPEHSHAAHARAAAQAASLVRTLRHNCSTIALSGAAPNPKGSPCDDMWAGEVTSFSLDQA